MKDSEKAYTQKSQQKATQTKTQGVGRLAIDGILAITDIVESMHRRIKPLSVVKPGTEQKRLSGISGNVYRNIRKLTESVGKSIDGPLASISKALDSQPESDSSQALISALNGVLGDYLLLSNNALAISMQFRRNGKSLTDEQLKEVLQQNNGKLLIVVHGLCMNDLQWCREGHDHGAKLGKELAMGVIYLHYNTGLHISENGKQFAVLLESLLNLYSGQIELNILAHSMGGLVSRSAFHHAQINCYKWPSKLKKWVFLGTPQHGADLEKAGNWMDLVLGSHSYTAPIARLIKIRSAGITDLRYGNVQDTDWNSTERFTFSGDTRTPLPLPKNVQCFAIATSANDSIDFPLGDGLVKVKSALGEHSNPEFSLAIPDCQKWLGTNINHMQLLSSLEVYQVLKNWLSKQY